MGKLKQILQILSIKTKQINKKQRRQQIATTAMLRTAEYIKDRNNTRDSINTIKCVKNKNKTKKE